MNPTHASRPSHESRFHYSKPGYAQPSQYQQFPPHPSVRVPPNVKLSAREVPAGVGVAAFPTRNDGSARPSPQPRAPGSGNPAQNFRFPAAPPIPASSYGRTPQDQSQSSGRKNNQHESYMSSVLNDFTPGTTPGSRSRGYPTPRGHSRGWSGSVYAESEALGREDGFGDDGFSPQTDTTVSPDPSPQVLRQASLGKRAKPALTTIRNGESQAESFPAPPTQVNRKQAMEALSAAVAAGMSTQPPAPIRTETPVSRTITPIRMPFDTSPPSSPSYDREFLQTPKTPHTITSTQLFSQTPKSAHSNKSSNPLLGLGIDQPAMSDKIPPSRRPRKLDMDLVREAQSRGSTTSLTDLIKRATKLAANLDRGKTASRLGMLDMFGSNEKLAAMAKRDSTMSDMLSAFPAPAATGTPTHRRDTAWPLGEKSEGYTSTTDLARGQRSKRRRRCCGMSLPIFFLVLIVLVILIAAAVLIPIFLILVPNQHKDSNSGLDNCASSHPCQHGGASIVSNDVCVCVCSNGFTGNQCQTSGATDDCMTITLNNADKEYKNATVGSSILPSLADASTRFQVPLNVSTILSLFSSNNLTCTSENSIVDFNSTSSPESTKTKRFIMVPELDPQPHPIDFHPHSPQITARSDSNCPGSSLERRQDVAGADGTSTQNGIVFQASTVGPIDTNIPVVSGVTSSAASTPSPTASTTGSSSSTTPSSSAPSAIATGAATDDQISFAKVVVLFVLQESRTISVAVTARQRLESFLFDAQSSSSNSTSGNSTVDVGFGDLSLTADFAKFEIEFGNGTIIGGK